MLALASVAVFGGSIAFAQESNIDQSDMTFARKAAAGGMAEVRLGKLAQEKGSNPAVTEFGKRMENDHSRAGEKLKEIASKIGVSLPTDMDREDQTTYERLSKLSGTDFDKAYAHDMVADHEKDITEFKQEAEAGKTPDIKNFAAETLPTLQDHLRQAREMEKAVNGQK